MSNEMLIIRRGLVEWTVTAVPGGVELVISDKWGRDTMALSIERARQLAADLNEAIGGNG